MKKYLLSIIFAVMFCAANAQAVIDSLLSVKTKIENAQVFDEERFINICYELCGIYYGNGDFLNAITILDYAKDVYTQKTSKTNSLELRNLMVLLTSMYYNAQKNALMAFIYGEKAEKMFEEAQDYNNQNYWDLLATMSSLYSFTFDTTVITTEKMREIAAYIEERVQEIKHPINLGIA